MSNIDHEVSIMNAVIDSMSGRTAPIVGTGSVSARGRLMARLDCGGAQETAEQMYAEGLLYLDGNVLRLNCVMAQARVKKLLSIVTTKHPSINQSLRDLVFRLMDKVTAVMTGFPTVTTWVTPATS